MNCVICGKAVPPEQKTFCSSRCQQVDLHRWMGGHYRVPTDEIPDETQLNEGVLPSPEEKFKES